MAITDPRDIPGLRLWVSAQEITGLSDGAQITTWNDNSGNANHLTGVAGTGGAKPLYRTTAGSGGGAAVQFQSGNADKVGGYFTIPAAVFTGLTSGSVFAICKSAQGRTTLWQLGTAAAGNGHHPFDNVIYEDALVTSLLSYQGTFTGTWDQWGRYVVTQSAGSGTQQAWRDNTSLGFGSRTFGIPATPKLGGGGAYNYAGHVAAYCVFDHVLTSGERADLESWASGHMSGGIPLSPPNVPTGLAATPTVTTIPLTWVAPAAGDAPTGYNVRIDGGATVDSGADLAHTFSGLSGGSVHDVEVQAYNGAGTSAWVALNDVLTLPSQPSGLSADPTETEIELSWNTQSADGFEVRIDGGTEDDVGNVLSHTFTGLDPATEYDVEVRAYNATGFSSWASLLSVTTDTPELEITAVEVAQRNSVTVTLNGLSYHDVDTWTLYRVILGTLERTPVRGTIGRTDVGDFVLTDHEAAIGTPVFWEVEYIDGSSGETMFLTSNTLTLGLGTGRPVVSNPLTGERTEVAAVEIWPEYSYGGRAGAIDVVGRADPVILTDVVLAPSSDPVIRTDNLVTREALRALLRTGLVIQLRTVEIDVEDVYLVVTDWAERRLTNRGDDVRRRHVLKVRHTSTPELGILAVGSTLGDIADTFDTLAEIADAFDTLLDLAAADLGSV